MSCRVCTNKSSRVLIGVEKRPMVKILCFMAGIVGRRHVSERNERCGHAETLAGGAVPLGTNVTTEPRFRTIGRAGPRERHFSGFCVSPRQTPGERHG